MTRKWIFAQRITHITRLLKREKTMALAAFDTDRVKDIVAMPHALRSWWMERCEEEYGGGD